MTVAVATRQLPSGASIPVIGLGVYESGPGDETYNSVLTALKLGYRHVDTARFYQNETDVYRAIVDSGVPRDEVFVTSKVFSIEAWTYDSVVEATKTSAANLGGYVDLYLLHAPGTPEGRDDAWRALEGPSRHWRVELWRSALGEAGQDLACEACGESDRVESVADAWRTW